MSLQTGRYGAYASATRATGTAREIEHGIFSRVTGALSRAIREDRPFPELATAMHENQRLWTALALDLADDRNALPEALRAQLLGLAQFVRNHTSSVLRGEAEASVLVEINTAVMRGLRGQAGTGAPPEGAAPTREAS